MVHTLQECGGRAKWLKRQSFSFNVAPGKEHYRQHTQDQVIVIMNKSIRVPEMINVGRYVYKESLLNTSDSINVLPPPPSPTGRGWDLIS